jgi:hypothetical protein
VPHPLSHPRRARPVISPAALVRGGGLDTGESSRPSPNQCFASGDLSPFRFVGLVIPLLLGWLVGGALQLALLLWRALLAMRHGNSLVSDGDLIGQVGLLRLPCGPRDRGIVRLTVRGAVLDVPAYSSAGPLRRGLAVMVLDERGGDVWLTPLTATRTSHPPAPDG